MDFTFTEEQQLLNDMVSRFVAREYTFEKRRAIMESAEGWSREIWQSFAELGLLALNTPELSDDPQTGIANTMAVMNALGAGMILEPYLASAVVATSLIRELANAQQQTALLGPMMEGSIIAVLATLEPGGRHDLSHVHTRATMTSDGFIVQGKKAVVAHAEAANVLLVSARLDGTDGISLFAVPANAAGVTLDSYRMLDGRRGADVTLRDVNVGTNALLGAAGCALGSIERAHDIGIAALAAEAAGAMSTLIDVTAEYLKTRKQFGQPIGCFQALQHCMAEMLVYREQARSISYLATAHCLSSDTAQRRKSCSAAKVLIARAGRFVRRQALQLHGGMGMTDELNVSHYFKQLMAMESTFGDADTHLERFIDASRTVQ